MIIPKKSKDILGMNARNLLYISRFNSRSNKRFADDKIFTKQFLESRGIGVAKLYRVVKNYRQLTHEFFQSLPETFVVKPNRGFAGGGILVIEGKSKNLWRTPSGKKINEETMYRQCIEILEGKYSISGVHDDIIFEEMLVPHSDFRLLTQTGLCDIRVIVFNQVPVMAMLRVPTVESEGKANMELGAIAMGIDIGSGVTTGAAKKSKFISKLPNGEPASGFQIPFWDEILLSCSKIQQVSNIGFLGVDLVITKTGVRVLEVNARPGLKIQVANRMPLKKRLDKVADLKILNPEEGVEVAKTLFAEKAVMADEFHQKPIVGIKENALLHGEVPCNLVTKIDLSAEKNFIRADFYQGKEKALDLTLAGIRMKIPAEKATSDMLKEADLILSPKFLKDFYIDPQKVWNSEDLVEVSTQSVDERMLRNIDEKICEIDSRIKLLAYINPRNLNEQKTLFLENPEFSPRFTYRDFELDTVLMRNELKKIPEVNHALYPLYRDKIREIEYKILLLEARGTSDFQEASHEVFGRVSSHLYQEALRFLGHNKGLIKPDVSPTLDFKKSSEILERFLKKHKLSHWQLKVVEDSVVDIQVTKRDTIILKKGATFQENRLKALLVHEVGTHVFRYENGKLQPLRILERGTSGYLRTEEGLAVWNQNQLGLDLGDKFLTPALQIVAIYMASKMGFQDLFHYLKNTFEINDDLAWKLCVKCKRGFGNTEVKMAFTKDMIYFAGNRDIEKFVAKHGDVSPLYVGKISVKDLSLVQKIEDLRGPKFLL